MSARFPSVIVTGSRPTEGRTLVTDFLAFLGSRCKAPLNAFTAEQRDEVKVGRPSALSWFLGEEVVDLDELWGNAEPDAAMFKLVGPSALERPFLLDLNPNCLLAFYSAIDQGYFDALPGEVFLVHVMTAKKDSQSATARELHSGERRDRLKRIGAKEILLVNEMEGPLAIDKSRLPVVRMPYLGSRFLEHFRREPNDMSVEDMVACDLARFETALINYPAPYERSEVVEFDAALRSWVGRTWVSFIHAGVGVAAREAA